MIYSPVVPYLALSTVPRILPYMIRKVQSTAIALFLATNASCLAPSDDGAEPAALQPQPSPEIPTYSYRVVHSFPHDPDGLSPKACSTTTVFSTKAPASTASRPCARSSSKQEPSYSSIS